MSGKILSQLDSRTEYPSRSLEILFSTNDQTAVRVLTRRGDDDTARWNAQAPPRVRLVIRPPLVLGEGPHGYLCRLAEANRLGGQVLEELGISFDRTSLLAAGCLNAEIPDAEIVAYVDQVALAAKQFPHSWVTRHCRFCPRCLQDNPIWHLGWELLFADACIDHGVWLIDQCGRCGRPVTWSRRQLLRCNCGALLTRERMASCPQNVVHLSAAVAGTVWGQCEPMVPGWFTQLDLGDAHRFIRFVGAYAGGTQGRLPQKIHDGSALAESWRYSSLTAEVLADWPAAFHQMVRGLAIVKEDAPRRLSSRFGNFYSYLYRTFGERKFAPLRAAFEEYVVAHWHAPLARRNRRLSRAAIERGGWVTVREASKALGISSRRLQRLMDDGILETEKRLASDGRRLVIISRASLDRSNQLIARSLDLKRTARILGLSRMRARNLIPRLFPAAVRPMGGRGPWSIPKTEISRILDDVERLPQGATLGAGRIALRDVLRLWAWSDETVGRLVDAWRAGRVPAVARLRGMAGLGGLVFGRDELRRWFAVSGDRTRDLSIPDAARRMRVKQEVAYALVRCHLLKVHNTGLRGGARISEEELSRFAETYVSAKSLASTGCTSPRKVIDLLRAAGADPITHHYGGTCRQARWRRPEIDPLSGVMPI